MNWPDLLVTVNFLLSKQRKLATEYIKTSIYPAKMSKLMSSEFAKTSLIGFVDFGSFIEQKSTFKILYLNFLNTFLNTFLIYLL